LCAIIECIASWYWATGDQTCVRCPWNHYCEGGPQSEAMECPNGGTTTNDGQLSMNQCYCTDQRQSSFGDLETGSCDECRAGYYMDGATCTECPIDYYCPGASISKQECVNGDTQGLTKQTAAWQCTCELPFDTYGYIFTLSVIMVND
jgi:hypothetical protein